MSPHSKPTTSTQRRESRSKGTDRKDSAKASHELVVRSVLIEPRENEPPRVSVSVEYQSEAPTMKELKKAALVVAHEVVNAKAYVDLGYRAQQTNRSLVQTFECREKEGK